jgi:DNA-binding transcriptional LysR family regulator
MLNDSNLARIDLNLLVLFAVVLEEQHVGRAATRLHLSPSAVSHGLKRLRRLLNDPLFLRTPNGVIPTARALELEAPVGEIMARINGIISAAEAFDPASSTRRFVIGAPDAVSAVLLRPLLAELKAGAPGVDIGVRQLLPPQKGRELETAWAPVLEELEGGGLDIAVVPIDSVPARFIAQTLYEERFVIVTREDHPFARDPSLLNYCEMQHILVSLTGDPYGLFEEALAEQGLTRRIALTVPNFVQAMLLVAETDLIAAMPGRLASIYAARFGLSLTEPPLPNGAGPIRSVATRAALMDRGVAWLFECVQRVAEGAE